MSEIGTVLILDDSLTVRMDLREAFDAAGWRTLPCATAAEAWATLATERVDAIVLDVLLPDADGVDVLRTLRTDPATASLPVLMLSSEAEVKDRIRGLSTGADEYLGKPYDAAYLVARAQELIQPDDSEQDDSPRILVIDEDATVQAMLQELLERNGYQVVLADSGLAGLRVAAARRADAVMVNDTLPDIDGATVIRRLRLDAALRGIPCLLLIASNDAGAELRALDAGADTFIRKDADPAVMLAKLSATVRLGSQRGPVIDTASLQRLKKILAIGGGDTALLANLAEQVRGEGYDVVAARTGEDAFELLAFQPTDCILLQLSDQDTDSSAEVLQVCRQVKSAPGVRDVPLILIAVQDDQQILVDALAAGADDYVLTSGDGKVLAARIRAQLQRRQLQDEQRQIRESLLRREIEATEARAEAQIAQTKADMVEELERKNQELEAFSYSVSHDLRTPLRAIDGFTSMLLNDVAEHLDESGQHYAARIRASVARMGEMIDDMLELSRVGRAQLLRRDVDLGELASIVLSDLAVGTPDRRVAVIVAHPLMASADPRLIRNVLENLLGNAWKFTAATDSATVEVGSSDHDGGTAYFVRDNGNGFDMARAGGLFTPFQRLHKDTEFPGTGIGLATVHRIIERHSGEVWAEAEVGHGATFWFTLPASAPVEPGVPPYPGPGTAQ
jgi:two-component system NtrC family sensor kinase